MRSVRIRKTRVWSLVILFLVAGANEWATAGDSIVWSEPACVELGDQTCVTYRATRQGDQLLISAEHGKSWHTYALDNDIRVKERLAGRASLGMESATSIEVIGAKTIGQWRQTSPLDLSQPDLRWYRWGFTEKAMFAIQLDPASIDGVFTLRIRGQACDHQRCQRVDVALKVSESMVSSGIELDALVSTNEQPSRIN